MFLIGRYAVKIPNICEWAMFLEGLLANMAEARTGKAGLPGFAPILFHLPCGFGLVMRRARVLTDEEFLALDFETWNDRGHYVIGCEPKSNSLGWIDGEVVAIDYGN